MNQLTIDDVSTDTIKCEGNLLSSTARDFRVGYIEYMKSEAVMTMADEDIEQACKDIEVMALQLPF